MNKYTNKPEESGRNNLCSCGSGKKHKNCCMFVGQQPMLTEESIRYIKKKSKYLTKKRKLVLLNAPPENLKEDTKPPDPNETFIQDAGLENV